VEQAPGHPAARIRAFFWRCGETAAKAHGAFNPRKPPVKKVVCVLHHSVLDKDPA
jgi:hypothetical protein